MDRASLPFASAVRPDRAGSIALDDAGLVLLRASRSLARALEAAVVAPEADLSPLHFDHHARGLALAAALATGVRANLLRCELVAGAFEMRAYVSGGWTRLTLQPGDFDPDAAWEFLVALNDAKLEPAEA